jgi:hypothetical protein
MRSRQLARHQPHCPAAGTEGDRGGPTVAAGVFGSPSISARAGRRVGSSPALATSAAGRCPRRAWRFCGSEEASPLAVGPIGVGFVHGEADVLRTSLVVRVSVLPSWGLRGARRNRSRILRAARRGACMRSAWPASLRSSCCRTLSRPFGGGGIRWFGILPMLAKSAGGSGIWYGFRSFMCARRIFCPDGD